jgi:Flp pilus assembly protein protease CpaA
MSLIFGLFLIPITISDLSRHLIPNIYLKIISCLMLGSFIIVGIPRPSVYLPCLFMAIVLFLFKVGMGDIKLLTILILTFNCQTNTLLILVSAATLVHIVISTARYRAFPHSIPLAPAIFFGLITYLATR